MFSIIGCTFEVLGSLRFLDNDLNITTLGREFFEFAIGTVAIETCTVCKYFKPVVSPSNKLLTHEVIACVLQRDISSIIG